MRRAALVFLWASLCLIAIWSLVSQAQLVDSDPCRDACHERQSLCVSVCGEHPNPIECQAECDEQLEECLQECS